METVRLFLYEQYLGPFEAKVTETQSVRRLAGVPMLWLGTAVSECQSPSVNMQGPEQERPEQTVALSLRGALHPAGNVTEGRVIPVYEAPARAKNEHKAVLERRYQGQGGY
ncbi:hypothetical protein EYF80_013997 [Liparis tanakae]|uniref:Uncharacterized protein n=1 Tax=Liparis tanakae TaxID=230148 RepID=A0A4Z2ID19_9TELE|nr:hypothetical protein EYF80_013997 [Liparis tanakae]